MALTITSEPVASPVPTPVSECLQWCLTPGSGDVLETPGSFANIHIEFPTTFSSIPSNGTEFTIWGRLFTVDNTTPYTATSFKIESSGNLSGSNFRRMLRANFFFSANTAITSPTPNSITDIDWNECGEQADFTGVGMDLSALVTAGATVTVTNGVTAIPVNGAMIQTRLQKVFIETGNAPITSYEGMTPIISCDTSDPVCVDYMADARRSLYTPMPDLSTTSEIDPYITTMIAKFFIDYGVTYRDDNCQAQSGAFQSSDEILVMDTVFELHENLLMRRYIYDHPDNIGVGDSQPAESPQFLTNKPKYLELGENSFAWLWLAAAYQSLSPGAVQLKFTVTFSDGTTSTEYVAYEALGVNQVHCFNVSPKRLISIFSLTDISDVVKYQVSAIATDDDEDITGETVGWETFFTIDHACENVTDVYFKTPPGGIGTILCEVIQKDVVQEGTEICLNTPCATTRVEAAKNSGRMLNQIRAYDTIRLRARRNFSEQEVAYFRSLKASPERWIQVEETGEGGTYVAKRLLIEPGGINIYQYGEYVDLIIDGKLQDIPIQNPRNAG